MLKTFKTPSVKTRGEKMKKLILLILLNMGISQAVLVKLPNAEILSERLSSKGFGHFAEKTQIVNQLANQELEVLGVMVAVDLALSDYHENLNNPTMAASMEMNKPVLLNLILKDSPKALEELRKHEAKLSSIGDLKENQATLKKQPSKPAEAKGKNLKKRLL